MSPVQVLQMSPAQVLQMSPIQLLQVQSSPAFTTCQSFRRGFFKLPAISSGFKSLLRLNWTSWAISHVYKDSQCYENQKICFWKRNIYKQEARQLY